MLDMSNYKQAPQPGGWYQSVLGGVSDTFSVLMDGALAVEQYKQTRDATGQGQADTLNQPTTDVQPNQAPLHAAQYQTTAAAAAGNPTAGASAPLINGVSNNTLLIGAGVLALLYFLK